MNTLSVRASPAHDVACGVLIQQQRVFLAHRHPLRRWYPNVWDLPGGHVEPGEDSRMTLRRELREELTIDNITLSDSPVLTLEDGELRLVVWQVHSWTGQIRNAAPDEHDAIGWFSTDEVHTMNLATAAYLPLLARLTA